MTSSAPVTAPRPGLWPALRSLATYVGAAGLGLVLASVAMMLFAGLQGVHCPECDRLLLGSDYGRWATYFRAKDALLVLGALAALAVVPFATRRRYGALAIALALVAILLTPG